MSRSPSDALAARDLVRRRLPHYLYAMALTALCTVVALPIAARVDLINIVMVYLLGAAVAGLWLGRVPSALTAVTNIFAFDYFFVPPRFSFAVFDTSYFVTFGAMLLVALIIANLMIAVRQQTEAANAREHYSAALFAISRKLAVERDTGEMVRSAVQHIGAVLPVRATVLLCDESGCIRVPDPGPSPKARPAFDLALAQRLASEHECAGAGAQPFDSGSVGYLPLRGSHITIGVLAVTRPEKLGRLVPEQQRLLEAITSQLALALERARLADLAHAAHLSAERAAMRNTLLASISHDLRTPLSAIAGAGSIVAQSDFALDLYRRVTLGRLIEEKARDMSDLLSNVLELVRLESGGEVLHRDWHALADIVGLAIGRQESRLTGRELSTDVPDDLPLLLLDANLMVQMVGNLLENAIKYTPLATRISLSARRDGAIMRLAIEDGGPGLGSGREEELFEKFTRGQTGRAAGGAGLGLAICRAVARLHGGDIRASSSPLGGARFEISIPFIDETAVVSSPTAVA